MKRWILSWWPLVWVGTLREERRQRLNDQQIARTKIERAEREAAVAYDAQLNAEKLARMAWRAMEIERAEREGREPAPRDPIGPPREKAQPCVINRSAATEFGIGC